jgi:predicted nucleic-acid-binding protein
MAILLDTNDLLRLVQRHHSHSLVASRATETLDSRSETIFIAHQSMVEF